MDDRRPTSTRSLRYGASTLRPLRGSAALLGRYGTLPVGAAMIAVVFVPGWDLLSQPWSAYVIVVGAVLVFFGLIGLLAGLMWRLRGRQLRGIVFRLDQPTPMVLLHHRTRTRHRPLSALRTIEVRYMSEWVNTYEDERDRDRPPWLRLRFDNLPSRRSTWYCLTPAHLNQTHPHAASMVAELRNALAGAPVEIVESQAEWRHRKHARLTE
ncbi:MAG TPA: hypothetical protein VGL06_28520 [Pseudonocardiaceae bacterium]